MLNTNYCTDIISNKIDLLYKPTDGEDQPVYNDFIEPTDPSLATSLDDLVSTEKCMHISCDEDLFERPLEISDQSVYKTILEGDGNSVYLQPDDLNLFKDLDLPVDNEKYCMYKSSSEAVVGQQGSITEPQSLKTRFSDSKEMEPVPIADFDLYSEVE